MLQNALAMGLFLLICPVCTVLYLTMAVAGWRLWSLSGPGQRRLRLLFAAQLILYALWSPQFFGRLRLPVVALVDILLLCLALGILMRLTWRDSRLAAVLISPYLAWVTFATCLNACIWQMNR